MSNKIKIVKDQAGTSALVQGIDVDPIPLNCYVCDVAIATDGITIKNPNAPREDGQPMAIFNNVHFSEFVKSDGSTPTNAADLKADIDAQLIQEAPTDVNAGYKGLWDASTNTPDLTDPYITGDWFYVGTPGTYNSVVYEIDDIIKYNGSTFDLIKNPGVRIDDILNSALSEYDIYVDANYTGSISTGSSLQPYTSLSTAITNSSANNTILVQGVNEIAAEIVLPHSLYIYGAQGAEIKYTNYSDTNGSLLSFDGNNTEVFEFYNIKFSNAGEYAVYIQNVKQVVCKDCDFINNGWNGTALNTILDSATSGVLGYDSSQANLQAFYAGPNASSGGAVRIEGANIVELIGNVVSKNLRGLRLQNCGVSGYGFISRNQVSENIESGIYLGSDSYNATGGCENFTVYNNASKYNANNGILVVGGINNVVSLNIVEGNWNAGIMGWHVSNTRFRDLDLTNNNRSQYNGIGNTGDAHATITIGGDTARSTRDYIAYVLGTEVNNTGLGSNTSRIGLQILEDVQDIADNYGKTLINIDNVGFNSQDYCIDSLADLDTVKLTIGDCRYIDTVQQNVSIVSGAYYELPYSNHSTEYQSCNFKVDNSFVIITEGVGGKRLNPYGIRDLKAVAFGTLIRVIIDNSDKVQFDLDASGLYIDDVLVTGTLAQKINQLNALLQNSGGAEGEPPVITSSLAISLTQGQTLNYELTADYGVSYEWDFSNVPGVTNVNGNMRKIIGGSSLAVGTYNIPVKAINYNDEDSETIVLTVSTPPYSNTKSIKFSNQDYLGANAAQVESTLGRSGNGSGSGDAWTISLWYKGSSDNQGQTIVYFGNNDVTNNGFVELRQTNHNGLKRLRLRYGSSNNYLQFTTSSGSITPGTWQHITVSYNGGTTGASSGSMTSYYSRFKIFINGSQQTTSNTHNNYGYTGSIIGQNWRVGRFASGSHMRQAYVDELALFDSDQSSNISTLYNSGAPFDLDTLTTKPKHWWRMGDGDTYPNIQDNGTEANCIFVMYNQTAADIVNDVP